jgi:N-carbamoylputrescine amidase
VKASVTLGLVQMEMGPDREANIESACALARDARERGAELVVFPELFSGRFFCKELDPAHAALAEPVPGPLCDRLSALARELEAVVVGSVFEKAREGVYFNTAVVFERDGALLGRSRKMHIPMDPGYLEKYYFTPGDTDYPVFRTSLVDLAVPTCWDQWFSEPARIYGLKGAELIVYPSAIGTLPGDPYDDPVDTWQVAMRGHAVCNALYVAAVNRVGDEDGMIFYGHSFVAQPDGRLVAEAGEAPQVLLARLDAERIARTRTLSLFYRDRRPETYRDILRQVVEEDQGEA